MMFEKFEKRFDDNTFEPLININNNWVRIEAIINAASLFTKDAFTKMMNEEYEEDVVKIILHELGEGFKYGNLT